MFIGQLLTNGQNACSQDKSEQFHVYLLDLLKDL